MVKQRIFLLQKKKTACGMQATVKDITDDVTLAVIINKELADCYRTWFKFMWDQLS